VRRTTTGAEAALDQRLAELESPDPGDKGNAFSRLVLRSRLRREYESLAAAYLSLMKEGSGSQRVSLKVLRVLDMMRGRDIALQGVRTAPIGPYDRQRWSPPASGDLRLRPFPTRERVGSLRMMRPSHIPFPATFSAPSHPDVIEFGSHDATGTDILDLSNVLILHLGFVGDALVIAVDSNLEIFFYGHKSVTGDRRLRWEPFKEYSYVVDEVEPDRLVLGPIVRPGVRRKLLLLAETLHAHFDRSMAYPPPAFFRAILAEMEDLIGYQDLTGSLRRWARSRNRSLNDICLVILPDESLFVLPIGFLGASSGEPLLMQLGGVANGLSLIALKWAAKDYHWYTQPNLTMIPRCTLFAAAGTPPLDLGRESQAVSTSFGLQNSMVLDSATRADFMSQYSAGDVCWFAGHGLYDTSHRIELSGEILPFPLSGPEFVDGALTNWDLIATSNWNFKALWLTIMNSCLLGRSILVGPNPMGYISALHTVGSIASVAALWPVLDEAATDFAQQMAKGIVANFQKRDFPRARALSAAVRQAVGHDPERQWLFAPYALWGLP
jgi:hypothetical protein